MKKLTMIAITCLMVLGLSRTVFADDALLNPGSANVPVKVSVDTDPTATKYRVDITWNSLSFVYRFGTEGAWNPSTHNYDSPGTDGWVVGANRLSTANGTITVTNHSNNEINVSATLNRIQDTMNTVTLTIDNDAATPRNVASAAIGDSLGDPSKAPSTSYQVTVGGVPNTDSVSDVTVANVTITVE